MRTPGSSMRWVALALAAVAAGARAQPVLEDDFETGTLLVTDAPPGRWDSLNVGSASNTLTATAAAAHRGALGLAAVDVRSTTGPGGEIDVRRGLTVTTGELHLRFWMRVPSADLTRTVLPLRMSAGSAEGLALYAAPGGPDCTVGGVDGPGAYVFAQSFPVAAMTDWHLYELSVSGVGTAAGLRRAWLDGQPVYTSAVLDYRGLRLDFLSFGIPWEGDRQFTGTLHFDDLRASTAPQASRLAWTLPATAAVGGCAPVTLALGASDGASSVTAPYAFAATVGSGAGELYGDAACGAKVTSAPFAQGQGAVTLYFRGGAPGPSTLSASYPDFLPASGVLTLVAEGVDAGAPGDTVDPFALAVGCGCGALPANAWLFALLALPGVARRRKGAAWRA